VKLTEGMRVELHGAANSHDGRIWATAFERNRNALVRRGLIDARGYITEAGRKLAAVLCECKATRHWKPAEWSHEGKCTGCGKPMYQGISVLSKPES